MTKLRWVLLALLLSGRASAEGLVDSFEATNQLEYSYSGETEREIVENWLDFAVGARDLRLGFLLNHQGPAEEGTRRNELVHRFVEISRGGVDLRVGHFYELFGRGLVLSSYEDRLVRVDTVLDGLRVHVDRGRWSAKFLSGAPRSRELDVRAADAEVDLGWGVRAGASALTYRADAITEPDGSIHREWVAAGRASKWFDRGDIYAEYGWKKGYDADFVPDALYQDGHAVYGAASLFVGPVSVVVDAKDYRRYTVVRGADGAHPLNRPPVVVREHSSTLLARAAYALDADDERGAQVEVTWGVDDHFTAIANVSRTESHEGEILYEEAYVELDLIGAGPIEARAGFGFQDSEGLRQTIVTDLTWRQNASRSWSLKAEHQHVRLESGVGFDLGAYDQQFFVLEHAVAPRWVLSAMLEMNNKYDAQQQAGEEDGPFPAFTVSRNFDDGHALTLWAGKRQAGQLCAGGVCKFEPAFEGVELSATVRY